MKDGSFRAFLDEFPDRTFWLGVLGQGDLNPVYNLCDVLVLPSIPTPNWDEHCATVLYEALACGKPVIASHSGGSPYILAPEDSILVDFMSAETLASAISTLYHDRIRVAEMSASAFRHYQRSYSQEVVGKRIVQELERLVRG